LTSDVANTANATGTDQEAVSVTDHDSASVDVIHPNVGITKECEPHVQFAPGTITWRVNATNIGDTTLYNVIIEDTRNGTLATGLTLDPDEWVAFEYVESGLAPGIYENNATVTGVDQEAAEVTAWAVAQCEVKPVYFLKQFTNVTVLDEIWNASIFNNGTSSNVTGLHSGPRVFWEVTYYFENSLNFLGDQFDNETHNFILWDKWGGNLLALNSTPTSFDPVTNIVTLSNGDSFKIDPPDYKAYVGSGLILTDSNGNPAYITMHTGDQQQGTNPGKGKSNSNDGKSYDTDVRWEIGSLAPGESASLTIIIAPGKNPAGILQFSSTGHYVINTGPRVRVYEEGSYADEDFLYAIDRMIQLSVNVTE